VARLVLYCLTLCIFVLGFECVTYSNVVFMEGTDRQCSVARLQCCIVYRFVYLYLSSEFITYSNVVFMEGTDRQCSVV